MELSAYEKQCEFLRREFDAKVRRLRVEYAKSNNTVVVGDTVDDSMSKICVDSISYTLIFMSRIPECVYSGPLLTKKGGPL